nr:putative uncharacterized protein DDB_G0290521 [Dermacentor andersoni]
MADDEVEQQLAERGRGARPKTPRQRKDSADKAGPSKSEKRPVPPPPPAPSPPKQQPVRRLCSKASQTIPVVCDEHFPPLKATVSGSPQCSCDTYKDPTAPDAASTADGQATGGTSGSTEGSPVQVPAPTGSSDTRPSEAPAHPAVETLKLQDFKRVAAAVDSGPAPSGSRTAMQAVRHMLARREAASQSADSTSLGDEPRSSAAAAGGSSGARQGLELPIALDMRNYAPDPTDDDSPGSPSACKCNCFKLHRDHEIESELVVNPRKGPPPPPLVLLDSPTDPRLNRRREALRQKHLEELANMQPIRHMWHRAVNTLLSSIRAQMHQPPPLSRQIPSPVPPSPQKQVEPREGPDKAEHKTDKEPPETRREDEAME